MANLHLRYGDLTFVVSRDQVLQDNFDFRYSVFYQKDMSSVLNALCDTYGSDKGEIATSGHPYPWPSHTYADFYEGLFGHCRDHIRTVFECGLGTDNPAIPSTMGVNGRPGASLRVWRDYFQNASIVGADIDRNVLFQEDRISTYYVDQTSPTSIEALWRAALEPVFDLMIDDGLHTYEAGVCLFEHAFSRLRAGGLYIIEDVMPGSMLKFRSYFHTRPHKVAFVNLYHKREESADNGLIVVRK